jgi:hypothetical protein
MLQEVYTLKSGSYSAGCRRSHRKNAGLPHYMAEAMPNINLKKPYGNLLGHSCDDL